MTPVVRTYAPVATLTWLLALACATQPPVLVAPPASSPPAMQPMPEPEEADLNAAAEPGAKRTELTCEQLDSLPDNLESGHAQKLLALFVRTASTSQDLDCVWRTVKRFSAIGAHTRRLVQAAGSGYSHRPSVWLLGSR